MGLVSCRLASCLGGSTVLYVLFSSQSVAEGRGQVRAGGCKGTHKGCPYECWRWVGQAGMGVCEGTHKACPYGYWGEGRE